MSFARSATKKFLLCCALAATTLAAAAADVAPAAQGLAQQRMRARPLLPDTVQNPGFEEFDPVVKLLGWGGVTHGGDSFRVEQDASQAHAGKWSLIIENTGVTSWGGAIQSIRADRFAGREVEFSAWVKTKSVTAPGSFIALKSSGISGELAYAASDDVKLIGDSDWKTVKLRTRVPKDAKTLDLILMEDGDGKTWVDDVRLEVLPEK